MFCWKCNILNSLYIFISTKLAIYLLNYWIILHIYFNNGYLLIWFSVWCLLAGQGRYGLSFGSKLCHSKAIKSILKATSKFGTEHKMCMLSQPDNYRKNVWWFSNCKKNTQHNRKIIISSLNIKYIRFTSRIKLFSTARFLI